MLRDADRRGRTAQSKGPYSSKIASWRRGGKDRRLQAGGKAERKKIASPQRRATPARSDSNNCLLACLLLSPLLACLLASLLTAEPSPKNKAERESTPFPSQSSAFDTETLCVGRNPPKADRRIHRNGRSSGLSPEIHLIILSPSSNNSSILHPSIHPSLPSRPRPRQTTNETRHPRIPQPATDDPTPS